MKILNAHTSQNWETIPVILNGFLITLPVFPLRARGQGRDTKPTAAFWGDPDNLDKLWFVVSVGYNGEASNFVPYAFIDPKSVSGAKAIEDLYNAELQAYNELSCEKEAKQLSDELEKLRIKYKKLSHS